MPRRKKTRTISTDAVKATASRGGSRSRQLRRDVAAEAARIMATESQRNFRTAKEKAVARLGIGPRVPLPSNREIEDELRAYQVFYGGDRHAQHLTALRKSAAEAMRALDRFRPRLVGPVLEGTADRHSRICLHLFCDPPDAAAQEIREKGIAFRQEERWIRWHDGSQKRISLLVTEAGPHTVELALFSRKDARQAPPSPIDGQPQRRAALTEVECLLAEA